MLQALDGIEPDIHSTAYVHPDATVIGDVTLEASASVWPGVVLRGDHGQIVLRREVNVQDNAVCHEDVELGAQTTVGHGAIVHNCTVGEGALIAMNAVVLDDSAVGDGAIVAAGSVVTEDSEIPANAMVAGTPASIIKEDVDATPGVDAATHYRERSELYRSLAEPLGR